MIYLICYVSFVIGARLYMRPGEIRRDWTALYQWPTNIFFAIDRLLNAVLFGDIDETISSRVGRLYPGSWLNWMIDIFAMDWKRGNKPGHCRKYMGY